MYIVKTQRARAKIFSMMNLFMGVYQVCSNKGPGVKIDPTQEGYRFSLYAYSKNLKNILLKIQRARA
jgi:hypothetical protein